ncbi:MAG: CRISPR-associated endonuclease Cas1 [Patescibacteria group bacterium]
MDLVVSTFGTRIRRQHEQIVLEIPNDTTPHHYPARRLERILIMGSSSISADAVRLAMKHGVDISYIGKFGKPEARIVPSVPTGSTKVRHAQFRVALSGGAFLYARQFVFGKMRSQIALAAVLGRDPKAIVSMQEALERALQANNVGSLMSAEGQAAERYFSGAWSHVFKGLGRDQRGGDQVNISLNYGYGVLRNEVERALLFAGLDPFVGMLHSERYGKPSLTLDFMEEFRVAVIDAVVLPLFANGLFTGRDFVQADGKDLMSTYGKKKILREIFTQLNVPVFWKGFERRLSEVITEQAQELARSLVNGFPAYEAFVAPDDLYEKSIAPDRRLVAKPQPEKMQ